MNVFPFVIGTEYTPHIARAIFDHLDKETLLKCRLVTSVWQSHVDSQTGLWSDISPQRYQEAVEEGRLDICRLIIENTVSPNPPDLGGWTPLHTAAGLGNTKICQLILEAAENKDPKMYRDGWTPLHCATEGGHSATFKLIMDSVEDKNPADKGGFTPLHLASRKGHLTICNIILENVADMNPPDIRRQTPLHEAAASGHLSIFQLLFNHASDKEPQNEAGKTPLDLAKRYRRKEVIQWIQEMKI